MTPIPLAEADIQGVRLHFELPRALVLNANDRMHWAPRNRVVQNLRGLGRIAARGQGRLNKAHLTIHVGYENNRRRDDHNLMPTYKALIDGIAETLLVDDSREYLTGPDLRSYVAKRPGLLVLDFDFEALS